MDHHGPLVFYYFCAFDIAAQTGNGLQRNTPIETIPGPSCSKLTISLVNVALKL